MPSIPELMRRNLYEVFNQRDPERRAQAIAQTYAEDVVFSDPEGTVTGREAIDAKAEQLLAQWPGFVFSERGPVRESGGSLGLLAWQFGPEGEVPAMTGTDIALIENGLITRMYTLLDG